MEGRALELKAEDQGRSHSDLGATSWTLCYFPHLCDRQCFPPPYWVLQFTQEIKLTNDRLVREKTNRVFMSVRSMHTCGKNLVMSASRVVRVWDIYYIVS